MEHRRPFYPSQMSEIDQTHIWNYRNHDPRLHLGNSPVLPTDGITVSGVNPSRYLNPSPRPHDYPSSVFGSGAPNHRAAYSRALLDPSSSGSASQFQLNRVQVPSCYDRPTPMDGSSMVGPPTDDRRPASKRTNPNMSLVLNRGDVSEYHCAGTSSNLHISSDRPTPMSGPHFLPSDLTSVAPSYWSNHHMTTGEGFERNVRSRHSQVPHLGTNPAAASVSGRNVAGQWNNPPESMPHRIISSDSCSFNYEMNRSLTGSTVSNGTMGISRVYNNSGLTQCRYPVATLPVPHGASTLGTGMGHGTYEQRSNAYWATSSPHPFPGFAAAPLEDAGPSGVENIASSSHSRPMPTIGRSSERNRRAMNSHGRFRSSFDDNAHNVWVSEAVVIMNPSIYYESSDLFDEYRDMRLDIDDMSYEELLALEESIGNASTGLSEDSISRCLTATRYHSSDQGRADGGQGNCVVCQEEYKELENLGRLKCGHGFHARCIKEWLLIKNACPICKAPALPDSC